MNGRFKKSSLSIVIALLLVGTKGVSAADYNSTFLINDGRSETFNEQITINSSSKSGLELAGKMGSFENTGVTNITTNGTVSTIAGIYVSHTGAAAQTGNATVTLGETHITSGAIGVKTSTPDNDSYTTIVTLGDNSTINASLNALNASENSTINVGNNSVITGSTFGASSAAVNATDGGTIVIGDGARITNSRSAIYSDSIAVMASDRPNTLSNGANIVIGDFANIYTEAQGNYSHAVKAGNSYYPNTLRGSGTITIGDNATISTLGTRSNGLYSAYMNSNITLGANSRIETKGNNAAAIRSGTTATGASTNPDNVAGGTITVGDSLTIVTSGTGAYGLNAQYDGSKIVVGSGVNITTENSNSHGVYAQNSGVISVGDNATITAKGYAVYANSGGYVELKGGTLIADDFAIFAQGDGDRGVSRVVGSGVFNITNHIVANAGGIVDMTFKDGSLINGGASTGEAATLGTVSFDMTGTTWYVSETSTLTSLNLQNSHINFANTNNWDSFNFNRLTVENLSGSGTFTLRADIVSGTQTDLLRVTGSSSGNHQLVVVNNGSAQTNGSEVLTVIETSDGIAQFVMNNKVELGGYLYDVRQNGTDWELFGAPNESGGGNGGSNNGGNNEGGGNPTPGITTTADAGANFLNISYLINYAETQTLLQRMGDLRQNSEQGDMWLHGFAGKFDSFAGGKLSHFDMAYNGIQFGADKRVSLDHPLFVGVYIGKTQGSPDYRSGDGTTKSWHGGIYGTYLMENGFYVDGIAKFARMKNQFNVKDSQNQTVNGNGSANGMSFSLEAGQKFAFDAVGQGFYLEPQVQFAYGHQNAATVKATNGLTIKLDGYDSAIGRASTLLGYDVTTDSSQINVYLKTGIVREFDGKVDYRLNGAKEKHSFKGNWWNNGVGVSAQINKRHTLYLDLESSTGNKFNQRQINGGYRFSF